MSDFVTKTKPNRIVRKTTAEWETADQNGNPQNKTINVEYYGMSVAEIRQRTADYLNSSDKGEQWFVTDTLFYRVARLNGETITKEWLEEQDIQNLLRVEKAINEADNPSKK